MPTEAKEARRSPSFARNSRTRGRMIVSEYRGLTVKRDRRDPARPAEAGRPVSRRQEPPDADRRRRHGRRGARPAAQRSDRDRVRHRRGRRRPRPSSMRPVRTTRWCGSRGRPGRPGDRRRRGHPARRLAVARGAAGQAGRWHAGAGRHARPVCSSRRCATWGTPWRRSPSRSARPTRRSFADTESDTDIQR